MSTRFWTPERQKPRTRIGVRAEAEGVEQRTGLVACLTFGLSCLAESDGGGEQAVRLMPVEAGKHIVKDAAVAEQFDVLEGAPEPE